MNIFNKQRTDNSIKSHISNVDYSKGSNLNN